MFVHALCDDWRLAWYNEESSKSWLQDALPTAVPRARIFAWGFNLMQGAGTSAERIGRATKACLADLKQRCQRSGGSAHVGGFSLHMSTADLREKPYVPTTFVTHSLGGILLKHLWLDALRSGDGWLLSTIAKVHFMAVPLRLDLSGFREFCTKVHAAWGAKVPLDVDYELVHSISQTIVEYVESDQTLRHKIVCWYETWRTEGQGLVQFSALAVADVC